MGALDVLKDSALALVFIGILVGAGAIALSSFQNTLTAGTVQYNVTVDALTGLDNATGFLPTIGTLVGVAALVAVVVGGLYFVYKQ